VVTKDQAGKVHINKDEMATRTVLGAAQLPAPTWASAYRPRSSAAPWSAPWSAESAATCGAACPRPDDKEFSDIIQPGYPQHSHGRRVPTILMFNSPNTPRVTELEAVATGS